MTTESVAVSVPAKKASPWFAETDPKFAREWLASLPLADSAGSARELYQSLYTLNRLALDPGDRFELMELYRAPVAVVSGALQGHFAHLAFPLAPKKRQLAEFVRDLQREMANGYKCCLCDQQKSLFHWGRKHFRAIIIQRAIQYLGEMLLRSYHVYMPYPRNTWKELHELYRHAELIGKQHELIETSTEEVGSGKLTIEQYYVQLLLLGLANPYQLPQNACMQVARLLRKWADKARLLEGGEIADRSGHFLVDLAADASPVPWPKGLTGKLEPSLRVLSAIELARTLHSFVNRLRKGEAVQSLDLGFEAPRAACIDLLKRLIRSWGFAARRRHSRIKRSEKIFLCSGISAIYFFANGQKAFAGRRMPAAWEERGSGSAAVRDIIESRGGTDDDKGDEPKPGRTSEARRDDGIQKGTAHASTEAFGVDRWRVRDAGPQGMALTSDGNGANRIRVGDLIGLQRVSDAGRWSVAVTRWLRSPKTNTLEIGVELLAADVRPVTVRPADRGPGAETPCFPGLLLPSVRAARQPVTLVIARGIRPSGCDLYLLSDDNDVEASQRVRVLKVLERTGSIEQIVFAEVLED